MPHSLPVFSVFGAFPAAYAWDFESDTVEGLRLTRASPTAAPGLVIGGSRWLLADSRRSSETWNQFLRTDPEVCPLRPNTAYAISFRYRVIEALGEKVFYLLLRSHAAGKVEGDRRGGWWEDFDEEVHRKNFIIRTGRAPDHYLIIGIRDRGTLVIDDHSLCRGDEPGHADDENGRENVGVVVGDVQGIVARRRI